MKSPPSDDLKRPMFKVQAASLADFKRHCELLGVTFWRGFGEAVALWVSSTKPSESDA
jgi:hypothetical protein